MDDRILKPIKEYNLPSAKRAKYISVLDKDPVMAARALTIKDIKSSINLLKETFKEIQDDSISYEPLAETILFSRENFIWFSTMLKEMENLMGMRHCNIPFDKCPPINFLKPPVIYQPFRPYPNSKDKGFHLSFYKILSKKLHPINNYRIKYIMENYDMSEFIDDCYPNWYLLKDTTIFEQYSEKTNTRVRVDFRDGELSYYIAGASDNWQKIERVPVEMDHVISALIFRNYMD